jgi:hypothetical protein
MRSPPQTRKGVLMDVDVSFSVVREGTLYETGESIPFSDLNLQGANPVAIAKAVFNPPLEEGDERAAVEVHPTCLGRCNPLGVPTWLFVDDAQPDHALFVTDAGGNFIISVANVVPGEEVEEPEGEVIDADAEPPAEATGTADPAPADDGSTAAPSPDSVQATGTADAPEGGGLGAETKGTPLGSAEVRSESEGNGGDAGGA